MNETPTPEKLDATRQMVGPHARLIQCVSGGSTEYDASKVLENPKYREVGLYGFAPYPDLTTTLPPEPAQDPTQKNIRANIEKLRRVFRASSETSAIDMSRRAQELKDLRWGMFICWSFSTFSGKEWTPGITNVNFFQARGVDTAQWVTTAKEAQMGYILFLTKHHDGFCLWDTKTTSRKVTNTSLGRDVLRELRTHCDQQGIKLALYFSEGEWDWPNKPDGQRYQAHGGYNPEMKKAQLRELLTEYGPIEYIWFDHAIGDGGLSLADTLAFCKALQPGCFIGFNHGDQAGADIRLGELGRPGPLNDSQAAGPYLRDGPSPNYRLAEFTYPILPSHEGGAMWFYSLPRHDQLCLPAEKIYADYLGAVKYGNIFSLDLGPDYAGRLREVDVKTLHAVGRLIRGQAIASP
jgi:alpha-L-fucosidase